MTEDRTGILAGPMPVVTHDIDLTPVAIQQTKELAKIGDALTSIAGFITNGGLTELLTGYAKTQAVKEIMGGLAAHDGRQSLNAQVLGQNALEISTAIELVHKKYHELLKSENKDPEIHDAESDYNKFKGKN